MLLYRRTVTVCRGGTAGETRYLVRLGHRDTSADDEWLRQPLAGTSAKWGVHI